VRILIVSALVILVDQLTKITVASVLEIGESVSVMGSVVRFTLIKNPGMAFGIRIGSKAFFTIFSSVASVIILVYLYRIRHEGFSPRFALALILGGALGNLIDRFAYGQVIDFIDVGLHDLRWPIFNAADIAVTVGMILLVTLVLFLAKTRSRKHHLFRQGEVRGRRPANGFALHHGGEKVENHRTPWSKQGSP